ncbi:unnamed protein product [Ectocarpus sp. CCAP 1310/34]|nr:unnamed protein product [Ectocarpus sp. CCAP 1310/34]
MGYGGAKRSFLGDKLCYHNMRGMGDYGKADAGEVVSVTVPTSKLSEFSKAYFDMTIKYNNRAGRILMDRGPLRSDGRMD